MSGAQVYRIEPGRSVECDYCSRNFTDSKETGGLLFGSYAAGPCCAARIEQQAKQYNEQRNIRAQCPAGMAFADWVRDVLRKGG